MTIIISWRKLNDMEQHREEDINLFLTRSISGPMMMACLAIFVPKISNKLINKNKKMKDQRNHFVYTNFRFAKVSMW